MPRPAAIRFVLAAVLGALLSLPHAASAQVPPGLFTEFRLLNGMTDGSNSGDSRWSDGWVTTGPLVTHGSNTVTNPQGMSSSSDFTATAEFGRLRFSGTGSASAIAPYGCYLAIDDHIANHGRAEFKLRGFVRSASLPEGTPAAVQLRVHLDGSVTVNDCFPIQSASAELIATDSHLTPALTVTSAGPLATGTWNTTVGDSIDLHGSLYCAVACEGIRTGLCTSASIAVNLDARLIAVPLTPGTRIDWYATLLDVPADRARATLAIDGAMPNPARAGRVAIRFTLPAPGPASLTLFDLAGRTVAAEDAGALGAGTHVVDLAPGRAIAPGIYLARIVQDGASRTARIAVLR